MFRIRQDPKPPAAPSALPAAPTPAPPISPSLLRLQKDLEEIEGCLPRSLAIATPPGPSEADPQHFAFTATVAPDEGIYEGGGGFRFLVTIKPAYPHQPPRVRCLQPVPLHPNIDGATGGVCLNILREDWSPVLGIGAVLFGLLHLFLEPAAGEPLNQEAGRLLAEDPAAFARLARQSFMH